MSRRKRLAYKHFTIVWARAYWPVILLISPIEISGDSHFPDPTIR
jgi:hypothetical protein